MNGLRALMPQTPKKERTDAAMGIAGMAMENQNIPPELKHAVEVKKAQDILQAADSQLAMERGQMQQPPQVVPRMRQQVNQRLQGQTMQGGLWIPSEVLGPVHRCVVGNPREQWQEKLWGQ